MAGMLRPLCWIAGFLAVALWVGGSLLVVEPAATHAIAGATSPGGAAQTPLPIRVPGHAAEMIDSAPAPDIRPDSRRDDPQHLEQFLRRAAAYDDDGSLRGMRVYPGWNEQVFDAVGLEPGDLIVAIDGEPLADPARASQALDLLGRAPTARVTVERDDVRSEFMLWFPALEESQSH